MYRDICNLLKGMRNSNLLWTHAQRFGGLSVLFWERNFCFKKWAKAMEKNCKIIQRSLDFTQIRWLGSWGKVLCYGPIHHPTCLLMQTTSFFTPLSVLVTWSQPFKARGLHELLAHDYMSYIRILVQLLFCGYTYKKRVGTVLYECSAKLRVSDSRDPGWVWGGSSCLDFARSDSEIMLSLLSVITLYVLPTPI